MSVLAREDIARRVSAALEAAVAADLEAPKAKISLAPTVVAPPAVTEPVPAPEVTASPGIEAEARAPASDDDDWVVGPVEVDHVVEAPTLAVAKPVELTGRAGPRPGRSRRHVALAAGLLVFAGFGVWAALASRSSEHDDVGVSVPLDTRVSSTSASETPTLRGTFTVWNGGTGTDPCAPIRSGAEPIEGDSIRLRGTDGGRLIMGALGSGSPTAARTGCSFPFVLRNIPAADKYVIAVAGQSSMILSREQLASTHWRLSMSLGSPSAG